MDKPITIGIAEDHHLINQGLCNTIRNIDDCKLLFSVWNGQELLEKLQELKPHIILLDINMPIMNGWDALPKVRKLYPDTKVIMFTSDYAREIIKDFINLGAVAFLYKQALPDEIEHTIKSVHTDGFYYDNYVRKILGLTPDKAYH